MLTQTPIFTGDEKDRNRRPEQAEAKGRAARVDNWPAILRAIIAKHTHAPFVWGSSDCSFAFDFIRDAIGFDAIESIRGYSSEAGALKALRRAGYASTLELIEQNFVEIEPEFAQRGDIGYPANIPHALMSPALIDGAFAYSKHPAGAVMVPRRLIVRAWAV